MVLGWSLQLYSVEGRTDLEDFSARAAVLEALIVGREQELRQTWRELRLRDGGAEQVTPKRRSHYAFLVRGSTFPIDLLNAFASILNSLDSDRLWVCIDSVPINTVYAETPLLIFADTSELTNYSDRAAFLERFDILCYGEGLEGLHCGPILRCNDDLDLYASSSFDWASMKAIREFGFTALPLSLEFALQEDPFRLAIQTLRLLSDGRSGRCVIAAEDRTAILGSQLESRESLSVEQLSAAIWSKGVCRSWRTSAAEDVEWLRFGSCLVPSGSDTYLESVSGKGLSIEDAHVGTVGEAFERFSAHNANRSLVVASASDAGLRKYSLRRFHPFGRDYDMEKSDDDLGFLYVRGVDEVSGENALVPFCLVPFPYVPKPGEDSVTHSCSTGLAAYTDRRSCVLRSVLEILERDDFYPSFLHQRTGKIVDIGRLDETSTESWLGRFLGSQQFELWLVSYDSFPSVPILHAFVLDRHNGVLSRGSGSGLDLRSAAEAATKEAFQIREQLLDSKRTGLYPSKAYREWASADTIAVVVQYLRTLECDAFAPLSRSVTTESLLMLCKAAVVECGSTIIAVDIPCAVREWHVVRALIPGMCCHQFASSSEGGKKLKSPAFKYGIPA